MKEGAWLETIVLTGNNIGDNSLEAVKKGTWLKTIVLTGNNIGDNGARALAEVHEQMPTQI